MFVLFKLTLMTELTLHNTINSTIEGKRSFAIQLFEENKNKNEVKKVIKHELQLILNYLYKNQPFQLRYLMQLMQILLSITFSYIFS